MLGVEQQGPSFGRKPRRHLLASWLTALAFGVAQTLVGLHVHALDAAETPESGCAACAYSATELLPGPIPATPVYIGSQRADRAVAPYCPRLKRQPAPFRQRAPPLS